MATDRQPRLPIVDEADARSARPARAPRAGPLRDKRGVGRQPAKASRGKRTSAREPEALTPTDLGGSLGRVLRDARKRQQVAGRAELSVSYLSQIERHLLTPSVGTLKRVAAALGVPTGQLIAPESAAGRALVSVLRKGECKRVTFPQSNISYELLVPDFRRRASALSLTAEPGAESGPEQTHEGEDIVVVLSGQLSVDIAGTWYELAAGDTISFNSELPHRWCNRGRQVAKAIWVSSPPYF